MTFCDVKEKGVKRGRRVFTRFRLNGSDIIHLTVYMNEAKNMTFIMLLAADHDT